jgi:GT2 family glycosyltransferase
MSHASIVIVSHNEGDNLRPSIDSLRDSAPSETEFIVVDDCSTDGSTAFLSEGYRGVEVIRPERRCGVAAARNFGAEHASGDIIVFSDAHVEAGWNWYEPMCRAAARPDVGIAAPTISALEDTRAKGWGCTFRGPGLAQKWLARADTEPYEIPLLCGCFMAMRRDLHAYCGGFDEGFGIWGHEDSEIAMRLWLMGYPVVVVPDADVAHMFRRAFPYKVDFVNTVCGALRMGSLHLGPGPLGKVMEHCSQLSEFPEAFERLLESDVWERRDQIRKRCQRSGEEFIDHFGIAALR